MGCTIMSQSLRYRNIYGDYWRTVDELIVDLICKHVDKSEKILEIGFGSGHFLAALCDREYRVNGVELRKEAFEIVDNKFKREYREIQIYNRNVMSLTDSHYNLAFSTGLLQCMESEERSVFLAHIAAISDKAVFTVPLIINERNSNSNVQIGVDGCTEYDTRDIGYLLSKYYGYVENGIWGKEVIELEDDYVWYYCNNSRCNR